MKTFVHLLAMLLLASGGCEDQTSNPPHARNLDDIRETVFRYQFTHNASGQQLRAAVYFLGLLSEGDSLRPPVWNDPSTDLMARFHGHQPPVKKYSECRWDTDGVFDRQTGARGLFFRIQSIHVIGPDEAEVEGGYFEAGLSASGNVYTVKRIDARWVVVKNTEVWIS